MKLLSRLSRDTAQETDVEHDVDVEQADTHNQPHQWTGASAVTTKAVTGVLWCALLAGPAALAFHFTTTAPAPQVVQADTTDPLTAERTAVSGFAEDFVVTWLTTPRGQEKALDRFVADAATITLPEKPWAVSDPATTAITSTDQAGVWAVTVAATVYEGKDQLPVRRYFQVPVRYRDTALSAASLPAPIAAPTQAEPDRLDYRYRATITDPVAAAANDFLSALLAGSGDVARYISPGSEISAITPPPYTTVVIEDVMVTEEPLDGTSPADGTESHLLVSATVTAQAKQDVSVQYALTLAARDGRWEVKAIDLAPTPVVDDDASQIDDESSPITPTPASEEPAPSSSTN